MQSITGVLPTNISLLFTDYYCCLAASYGNTVLKVKDASGCIYDVTPWQPGGGIIWMSHQIKLVHTNWVIKACEKLLGLFNWMSSSADGSVTSRLRVVTIINGRPSISPARGPTRQTVELSPSSAGKKSGISAVTLVKHSKLGNEALFSNWPQSRRRNNRWVG